MQRISHVTLSHVLCELCLILLTAKGQTVTFQSSSSTAVLDDSFQFTCTVNGGGSLQGLLSYTRGLSPSASIICTVNTAGCSQFTSQPGYTCGCVSGQTGVFYTNISSVSWDDDDDNWRCQYSGIPSSSVSLDVYYSPMITSVPSNKDVTENTSPNIDCSSNIIPGNPSSTRYRWTGPGGYSKTGAVLGRTVTRTQGGQYTCTVTNTAGLSDTGQVNINVQYSPMITSVPSNKDVTENTSPNIDCSSNIIPGNPSSTSYMWTGPGGYSKTGVVLDRTVTRTQGGQYICTATNTAGLSDNATVNINVQYAPTITSIPNNKDVAQNTSPNIDCSSNIISGNPSSMSGYRWTGPGSSRKTGAVLDRTVTRTQGGQYTCIATNIIGLSDTATVNINVISSLQKLSENNSGMGRGIGIGFGICLPIIIGLSIGVIFLVYRQHDTKKKYKETLEKDKTQTEVQATSVSKSTMGDMSYSVLHHDSSSITQHERIQMEQKGTDGSRRGYIE